MIPLKLYNTDGHRLEVFRPIENGCAGLYSCGPTVYSNAHIGNLRAYLHWDVLRRVLERFGYKVNHVMNITDVGHLSDYGEDKMLQGARVHKMSVWDVARHFTAAFWSDAEALNILRPHVECRATDHIGDMIALIRRLEEKGLTYEAGGNVYFETTGVADYGRMAFLDRQQGDGHRARVASDPNKRHDQDFVLWFTHSKFENQAMVWDSPWGRGYPGWHLECSAMSAKYLGERFDIHTGGIDHISIHHTNEIAQSEGAFGHRWVNYWIHNEFLIMKGGKMSKSQGKTLTLKDLLDSGYHAMDYRYFIMGGHYRSQLIFNSDSLESAASARHALNGRIASLKRDIGVQEPDRVTHPAALARLAAFDSALGENLNTPRALAELWGLVKDGELPPGERLAAARDMDAVLGLRLGQEEEDISSAVTVDPQLQAMLERRQKARDSHDWTLADSIRDQLAEQGWHVLDTPQGSVLNKTGHHT